MNHHQYTPDELFNLLESSPLGLSELIVNNRLLRDGPNDIHESHTSSPLRLFVSQFADFMILVLIAAAGVSLLLGDVTDMMVILGIVVLNACVGFFQEYKAERAIVALKSLSVPLARVIRNGNVCDVNSTGIVKGDVLLLEAGNIVPADARVISVQGLRVDEAALTGESQVVDKDPAAIHGECAMLTRPAHCAGAINPLGCRAGEIGRAHV